MVRTSITPQQTDFVLSIPPQYIGKKLEVLLYAVEEITEEISKPVTMAQFRGILSRETAQDILHQAGASRAEWDLNWAANN